MRDSTDGLETTETCSQSQLERIAAKIPGAIYQLQRHSDGTISIPFITSSCREILGVEAAAVQANANLLLSAIHPDDRQEFDRSLARSAQSKQRWFWQGRLMLPGKQMRWVQAASQPEALANGGTIWDGMLLDITQNYPEAEYQTQQTSSPQSLYWLERVINRIPKAIFWKDCNSVYRGCNQQFARMVGLENSEEIVGKTDEDLLCKSEELDRFRDRKTRSMSHKTLEGNLLKSQLQNRQRSTWFDSEKIPIKDAEGNVIGLVGTIEDITERKQIALALRDYQNELLTLFGAMRDVILVFDREGCCLRIVPTNPPELYKTQPELIGQTLHDVLPVVTANLLVSEIQNTLENRQTTTLEHSFTIQETEVWFDISIAPLQENTVIWVARDITERKQAELAKEESKKQLQAILDYAPAAIFIKNLAGKYLVINRQAQEVLNLESQDIIGKTDRDFWSEDVADKLQSFDRDVIALDAPLAQEVLIPTIDEIHTYLTVKFPLRNSDGVTYAIGGIATDITERKRAEEQLQEKTKQLEKTLKKLKTAQAQLIQTEKMLSLSQLVAGIAHEINNPINFIHANLNHARIYIEDLLKILNLYETTFTEINPEIEELSEDIDLEFILKDLPKLLGSMQVGTQRIRGIVRSLRTFSRLDEAERKRVDIHEGIESTLMMLQHQLKTKPGIPKIELIQNYGKLPLVDCYAGQLNQVFLNIFSNAIDALEEAVKHQDLKNPTISIATELLANDRIAIRIADNGIGLSETVKKQLFDPFFTTKQVGKGTGMGMSICYQIVTEQHGGSINFISEPGEGAEFILEIPVHQ